MILKSVKFSQHENTKDEWKLEEVPFSKINLIVGKNATGKSMTLNIISSLSKLLSREKKLPFQSGNFLVKFDNNSEEYEYTLQYENNMVIQESLKIKDEIKLQRGEDGEGWITAIEAKIPGMRFKTPLDEITALTKRDSIQHPFLDILFTWAENTFHFYFGSTMGKDYFMVMIKDKDHRSPPDHKDTQKVVDKFFEAEREYGKNYTNLLIEDMAEIGYDLSSIRTGTPRSLKFKGLHSDPIGMLAKEKDLKGLTDQHTMSQGMFRTLSLLVQVDYLQLKTVPSCILIDDIGEGLDYDRSTRLIKLLMKKAEAHNFQIIMSTNDRFVMNNVPIEYWSLIHRDKNISKIYNYNNSKEIFKDFELTGLNNFDFFTSEYFLNHKNKND